MSFKQLIFRSLKKNLKNYYLYVFALVFSVALYFSFVTLQYDPSMDSHEGSIKGAAAIKAASVMLIVIVTVFLVYANNLFIKRRSHEIGLYQLVGLTKGKIFQILTVENLTLYFGSMLIGIFIGFSVSKLILMILMRIIGLTDVAELQFSTEAFSQTIIVFTGIYLVIMLLNALFIKRQRILSLFHRHTSAEQKVLRISRFEMLIGMLGLILIGFGYYLSTRLFSGDFVMMNELFLAMITILASVILGTYLFYKGSISFIFNIIRKRNNGYLSIHKVLSLSSIMFRMKSNSFLLTVITTVSALAIGLLSLSYISYYSAETQAKESVPNDFSIPNEDRAHLFMNALDEHHISYSTTTIDLLRVNTNISNVIENHDDININSDFDLLPMLVLSNERFDDIHLDIDETIFVNYNKAIETFISFKDSGQIILNGKEQSFTLQYLGVEDESVVPLRLSGGGFPALVVHDDVYQQLIAEKNADIQDEFQLYVGIDINDTSDLEKANELFSDLEIGQWAAHQSQLQVFQAQKHSMGLTMFIVGFLGLTFLITSGCILYFKQMDQGEDEKGAYTILRKLGFTNQDLLKGIRAKQLFNFGIPLLLGLSHSYFAVKSGWFYFGTELWTPMLIVMVIYTVLYSIFGMLSIKYYKKLIKEAL